MDCEPTMPGAIEMGWSFDVTGALKDGHADG